MKRHALNVLVYIVLAATVVALIISEWHRSIEQQQEQQPQQSLFRRFSFNNDLDSKKKNNNDQNEMMRRYYSEYAQRYSAVEINTAGYAYAGFSLVDIAKDRAVDNKVTILVVNDGFLPFAINWLCALGRLPAADRAQTNNYIFIAEDPAVYQKLVDLHQPAYFDMDSKDTGKVLEYGQVAYQRLMIARVHFVTSILQAGYSVLIADIDAVWRHNPWPFIDALAPPHDMVAQMDEGLHNICGGFLYFRGTDNSRAFWAAVEAEHSSRIAAMRDGVNIDFNTEQHAIEFLLQQNNKPLRWTGLPRDRFPSGQAFFVNRQGREDPVVVHNNYIIGYDNKINRFKEHNFWLLDHNNVCPEPLLRLADRPAVTPEQQINPLTPSSFSFDAAASTIRIKIMAEATGGSFAKLLASLSKADYDGRTNVFLDVYVDKVDSSKQEEKIIERFRNFDWRFGSKQLHVREDPTCAGSGSLNIIESWWPLQSSEFVFFLHDSSVVSPYFFKWSVRALQSYAASPQAASHRFFGIGLHGTAATDGQVTSKPDQCGMILFPQTWQNFRAQLAAKSFTKAADIDAWGMLGEWAAGEKRYLFHPVFADNVCLVAMQNDRETCKLDREPSYNVFFPST